MDSPTVPEDVVTTTTIAMIDQKSEGDEPVSVTESTICAEPRDLDGASHSETNNLKTPSARHDSTYYFDFVTYQVCNI